MLTYDLEKRGKYAIYEYLYFCIRNDIIAGKLRADEKLPSKREMARNHAIAVITVENAYAQLIVEGYIYSKEKSGYYVNPGMQYEISTKRNGNLDEISTKRNGNLDEISTKRNGNLDEISTKRNGNRDEISEQTKAESKFSRNGDWTVDFTSKKMSSSLFPFSIWSRLMRRVLSEKEYAFLEKPEHGGVPELRRAIKEYLLKAKGLAVRTECIVVGPGTEYLHHILLQLIGHNRLVAVEDPGYEKVGQIYESNGMKCLHIPVDQHGIIVDRLLESNASLVHISPSHHFPTGCVMPVERRYQLLEWAKNQRAYIIEDDYDSEFRFSGRPIPTLSELDEHRVIYMNTFTKTLTPSIRIAYMVLPEELANKFENRLGFYSGAVSSFEQYALAAFIREGYYERHISRMRNYYRQQRSRIMKAMNDSPISKYARIQEDKAGLHFILYIPKLQDDWRFITYLMQHKIRISAISEFSYYKNKEFEHKFIINYADVTTDKLQQAFKIMADAIEMQV